LKKYFRNSFLSGNGLLEKGKLAIGFHFFHVRAKLASEYIQSGFENEIRLFENPKIPVLTSSIIATKPKLQRFF
jgi:hypothetical protein